MRRRISSSSLFSSSYSCRYLGLGDTAGLQLSSRYFFTNGARHFASGAKPILNTNEEDPETATTATSTGGMAISSFAEKFKRSAYDLEGSNSGSFTNNGHGLNGKQNEMKDALHVIKEEMEGLNANIQDHLAKVTESALLAKIASYFFNLQGKRFRPAIVFLTSKATSVHQQQQNQSSKPVENNGIVNPRQVSLAEIMEMIHTASLIHDDILDEADTRRGFPTVHKKWDAKKAVLAGDYLLARASLKIAHLKNHEVTELLSTVISDLVQGEFFQATKNSDLLDFDSYLRKTYLKTASLIEKSCRCAAILGDHDETIINTATEYGKNLGIAFQLVDDMLDYTSTSRTLGKPAGTDLSLGLATAPALFAAEEFPQMRELILRRFQSDGDVEMAQSLVQRSRGIQRTAELAKQHCDIAAAAIMTLTTSQAREALVGLTHKVLTRKA